MKKRNFLTLAAVVAFSTILNSCGGDTKVEQTAPSETIENTTPEPVATPEAETTAPAVEEPISVEVTPEIKETPKTEVKTTSTVKTTETALKTEVKKVEQKVAEVQQEVASAAPTMVFEKTEFDFGDIAQGDKVEYTFKFKNTGNAPLIISNARASCGCTVPEWPKEPVAPGQSGKIDVVFNSSGKSGAQNKAVTITTNIADQPQQMVYLKGNVTLPQPSAE